MVFINFIIGIIQWPKMSWPAVFECKTIIATMPERSLQAGRSAKHMPAAGSEPVKM